MKTPPHPIAPWDCIAECGNAIAGAIAGVCNQKDYGIRVQDVLKALADQRHDYLRAQALALGARFYEEKPSVFCKRLRQYWKRWRREPKLVAPRGGAPK